MATASLQSPVSQRSQVKETDTHAARLMLEDTEKGSLEESLL